MSARPPFVQILYDRPLPELTPPRLTDSSNPPYSTDVRAQIADLGCHPLLESAVSSCAVAWICMGRVADRQLHLMNDDLFSAHFLLRKMQENEWGKWLHAMLHQAGELLASVTLKFARGHADRHMSVSDTRG